MDTSAVAVIVPIVVAILGAVAWYLERKGNKQASMIINALIKGVEKGSSAVKGGENIKKAIRSEAIFLGVEGILSEIVKKATKKDEGK